MSALSDEPAGRLNSWSFVFAANLFIPLVMASTECRAYCAIGGMVFGILVLASLSLWFVHWFRSWGRILVFGGQVVGWLQFFPILHYYSFLLMFSTCKPL